MGYKQAFLEHYTPNGTAYLPESLRAQLHALGRPPVENTPAGTFARDILNRLLIDLSWASSQLEGNTYTRLDTERLIEFGQAAAGKDALETQMILNHKAAIEYLVRDTEHVGIHPEAVAIIQARKPADEEQDPSPWVFPANSRAGYLDAPKKRWAALLQRAGLEDLRLHDLRRSMGSWQAKTGASLLTIGKSLGHKSASATLIYARLDVDPVRASMEKVAGAMLEAGGMKAGAKVKKLRKN